MSQQLDSSSVSDGLEAQERYRVLVENSLVGVIIIQQEMIVFANSKAAELIDCSQQELLGTEVLSNVHPADVKRVQQYHILRQLGRSVPSPYDARIVTHSGEVRHIEFKTCDIVYGGLPALIASVSDITARVKYANALKRSEERYRLLFNTTPDVVMLLEDDKIAEANPAAKRVFGYEQEELIGKTLSDMSPERQPGGVNSYEKSLLLLNACREQGLQVYDWVHLTSAGENVDCEVTLTDCRLRGQSLVQVIIRDVSERKRKDESHRALERSLEEHKRRFYRNTILSFTDGKLDVVELLETQHYTSNALLTTKFAELSDICAVRRLAECFCMEHGLDEDRAGIFAMGFGEALNNAVIHAGGGTMLAGTYDSGVWVGVVDHGTGIDSLLLPRATLGKGFSTKSSMGLGFTVVLDVCEHVLLHSAGDGTSIIMMADFLPDSSNCPAFLAKDAIGRDV